jgi:uncharacterized membrane protein
MSSDTTTRGDILRALPEFPADIGALFAAVIVADVFVLAVPHRPGLVDAILGIPVVAFLPGYALVAAVFPKAHAVRPGESEWAFGRRLRPRERAALSFGLSLLVVPVVLVGQSLAGFGLTPPATAGTLTLWICACLAVFAIRRHRLPASEKHRPLSRRPLRRALAGLRGANRSAQVGVVALALAVLIAVVVLSTALLAPPGGNGYTRLSLLGGNDSGTLVGEEFPDEVTANESLSITPVVENHEHENRSYRLDVRFQQVNTTGELSVTNQSVAATREFTVADGATWQEPVTVSPGVTGDNVRLLVTLAESGSGTATDAPYRQTYLWLNVTETP